MIICLLKKQNLYSNFNELLIQNNRILVITITRIKETNKHIKQLNHK